MSGSKKPYVVETEMLGFLALALRQFAKDAAEDVADLLEIAGEEKALPDRAALRGARLKLQKEIYKTPTSNQGLLTALNGTMNIVDAVLELYEARSVERGVDSKENGH